MYPDLAGYAGWTLQNVLWGEGAAWSDEWEITLTVKLVGVSRLVWSGCFD